MRPSAYSFGLNKSALIVGAQQIAGTLSNVVGTAVESIANGITGLIEKTQTWGQALVGIGQSIVHSIIQSFAQLVSPWIVSLGIMLVKWVATRIFMVVFDAVTETTMTTATLTNAAIRGASAIQEGLKWLWNAAVKGATAVADIPYVGPILAILAMGGIIAAGMAAMGAFAEGGMMGGQAARLTTIFLSGLALAKGSSQRVQSIITAARVSSTR